MGVKVCSLVGLRPQVRGVVNLLNTNNLQFAAIDFTDLAFLEQRCGRKGRCSFDAFMAIMSIEFCEFTSRLPKNNSKQDLISINTTRNESQGKAVQSYLSRSQTFVSPATPKE